jgi:serine protease Do
MSENILHKCFLNRSGLLIFVFPLAMVLMPLQTVLAQSAEDRNGLVGWQRAVFEVAQKITPNSGPIELIPDGEVRHGWLGVSVQDLTPDLANAFGAESTKGALVAMVVKGGPADRAGIQRGDVITAYRNKKIPDSSSLRNEIATSPIDQEVTVTLLRKGKQESLTVKIGNAEAFSSTSAIFLRDRLGAEVRPLTVKEVTKYHLNSRKGVAIVWLDPEGLLREVGFEVGDMILEINGRPIKGLETFVNLAGTLQPSQQITLLGLDHRSGRTGYVQVKVR